MSFKLMIIGLIVMFASFMLTASIIMNAIPPSVFIWSMLAIGIISGMVIMLISIIMNGIIGPFLSAKTTGHTILSVVTASKKIDLLSGKEKQGWVKTARGFFQVRPNSVYSWPNGVPGAIAYYKYGISLEPKHIEAASQLERRGSTTSERCRKL